MLKKLRNSQNNKGFTIIEVMIVLAIAGLIILVVLLAVPALQRNGRNTALKQDASSVVSGISEYTSNNDGQLPTATGSPASSTGTYLIAGASGTTPATVKVQSGTTVTPTPTTGPTAAPAVGTINVVFGYKCAGTGYTGVSDLATSARSAAVIYSIETSSSVSGKCIGS